MTAPRGICRDWRARYWSAGRAPRTTPRWCWWPRGGPEGAPCRADRVVALRCVPFAGEDGVDQRIRPTTLDPVVLPQVRLAPHAQLLHHPIRADVGRIAVGPDAVQAQLAEAEVHQRPGGLGRVATPPVVAM